MSLSEGANCCRHGLGHWDELAGDLRLGLGAKLEAAATEKRGKNYEAPEDHRMLPKGARAIHILPPLKYTQHLLDQQMQAAAVHHLHAIVDQIARFAVKSQTLGPSRLDMLHSLQCASVIIVGTPNFL